MNKGELIKIEALKEQMLWHEERVNELKWWQFSKRTELTNELWYYRGKQIGFQEGINFKDCKK